MACDAEQWTETMNQFTDAVRKFNETFADRDEWHAVLEGQWPDRFVLLNRFIRTGHRPPFIFND